MKPDLNKLVAEYGSEENIAERIREEMKARGWSQAKLAKEMAANGYPLHQSAISKIVSPPAGDGRRSVSVDEALGFAKTLGIDLPELLIPGSRLTSNKALKLLTEGHQVYRQKFDAELRYESLVTQLVRLALADEDARFMVFDVYDALVRDRTPEEVGDSIHASFLLDVIKRISEEGPSDGK